MRKQVHWWHVKYGIRPSLDEVLRRQGSHRNIHVTSAVEETTKYSIDNSATSLSTKAEEDRQP